MFTSIKDRLTGLFAGIERAEETDTGAPMYLIAGLGNPGAKYEKTKHNVGFDVIAQLENTWSIPESGLSMKGIYGKGFIEGQRAILLRPMSYMNLSGEAIRAYVDYYRIDPETELIVIEDDISLPPGKIRIRTKGSAGGHNGLKSIISMLGTDQFTRVRIGIGEKPPQWDLADYVLAPFSPEDRKLVDEGIRQAADAVGMILRGETERAMTLYNSKEKSKKTEKTI